MTRPPIVRLRKDVVLAVHDRRIREHGGLAGVRDRDLLDAAIERPRPVDLYADPPCSLADLAAYYGLAVVRNHPFVDGDRRTALVMTEIFLLRHGLRLTADDADCFRVFTELGSSTLAQEAFIDWVGRNAEASERRP